jgi:hypothetical protein
MYCIGDTANRQTGEPVNREPANRRTGEPVNRRIRPVRTGSSPNRCESELEFRTGSLGTFFGGNQVRTGGSNRLTLRLSMLHALLQLLQECIIFIDNQTFNSHKHTQARQEQANTDTPAHARTRRHTHTHTHTYACDCTDESSCQHTNTPTQAPKYESTRPHTCTQECTPNVI